MHACGVGDDGRKCTAGSRVGLGDVALPPGARLRYGYDSQSVFRPKGGRTPISAPAQRSQQAEREPAAHRPHATGSCDTISI